jgi:outer membrane protein
MNFIRKYLLTFIVLGLINKGFSQENNETLKLSISEAQTYALQNSPSVKSAKIDISMMEKQVWENLSIGLPQLNLSTNFQHQFVIPQVSFGRYLDVNSLPDGTITKDDILTAYKDTPPISLGVRNNTTFDFTLSQLIFSGEYLVGLQAAKVVKQATEKSLVKTEAQTKESVAGTYNLVLILGENIRLLKESLKSTDQTYNDMIKMNQQGLNEETDVDQMKINRSNIQTLITSLESQKEISLKLLKYQLGVTFSKNVELTDSLQGIIDLGNAQYLSAPEFKVEKSVDYQMISDQEKVSGLMLKREQAKILPTISAFYRRHEQTQAASLNFAVKDLVGVSLTLPIFSSGQRSSRISEARYALQKSRLNKENAEKGLIMEFETALSSYQTAYSNFTANKIGRAHV